MKKDYIYDIETFPNVFTFAKVAVDNSEKFVFEISDRTNDIDHFLDFCRKSMLNGDRWIGYNNLGFDYPVVHWILEKAIKAKKDGKKLRVTASQIYKYAMKVIDSNKDGFGIKVKDEDILIEQIDLFKINHFDNKAKATSLKLLEFNMRLHNIEDLPFPVGKILDEDEIKTLVDYNISDIEATLEFYNKCKSMITLREDLTVKYGFNCMNLNDSKIGERFFINKIESVNPKAFYNVDNHGKRVMRQTKRSFIDIGKCIFPYVKFYSPEFNALKNWFSVQKITETNGVFSDIEEHLLGDLAKYSEMVVKKVKFKSKPTKQEINEFMKLHPLGWIEENELKATETLKDENGNPIKEDYVCEKTGKVKQRVVKVSKISYNGCYRISETLNVVYGGLRIDFGVGGVHAAKRGVFKSTKDRKIKTWDVASMYPNIAISNKVYPEHLGVSFCKSYEDLYNERKLFPKGTGENLAIKLALNATYGNSNNKYSPFFDPMYTMKITINGQLSLAMLIEKLVMECNVEPIMLNTDGCEVLIDDSMIDKANSIVSLWEKVTGLIMEGDDYDVMYIADVNNYTSKYTKGGHKSKGRYEWSDLAIHKNMSALIVPMAVEHQLLKGGSAEDFIKSHKDPFDFMLRAKLPRSMKLVLNKDGKDLPQQNICRYYVANDGGELVKIMPPLKDGDEDRRMNLESGWLVKTCNNMDDFDWDINYDYYINEANKLLEPFIEYII